MKQLLKMLLLSLAAIAVCATPAWAAVVNWNVASGDVSEPLNWDTELVPTTGDQAIISNEGTATISAGNTFDGALLYLDLGTTGGSFGNVEQTGGAITTAVNGSNTGWLRIGNRTGNAEENPWSTYDMSGGTASIASLTVVGLGGKGKLLLSGGTEETPVGAAFTCTSRVYVGDSTGTGILDMSEYSSFSALYLSVGRSGGNMGTVTMSGHANMAVTGTSDSYFGTSNVGAGTGALTMEGDATATISNRNLYVGDGGGTGSLTLSGNASLTSTTTGTIRMGQGNGSVGTLTMSGRSTMISNNSNTDTWGGQFWIGKGAGGKGTVTLSGGTGYAEETRGAKLVVNHITNIGSYGPSGELPAGKGFLNVHEYAQLETAGLFMADGGSGTLLIDGHGQVTVTGGKATTLGGAPTASFSGELKDNAYFRATGDVVLGDNRSTAELTLTSPTSGTGAALQVNGALYVGNNGTDTDTSDATLNINAGTSVSVGGHMYVGQADNARGTVVMNGGSITTGGWFCIARTGGGANGTTGTLTMYDDASISSASSFFVGNAYGGGNGGTGIATLNDNTRISSNTDIRIAYGGVGTLTVGDGTAPEEGETGAVAHASTNIMLAEGNTSSVATLNLNVGGTVETPYITSQQGTSATLNFDGGLLKALENTTESPFISNPGTVTSFALNVLDGGARIDTNGFDATITEGLLDGDELGGGLTKLGDGTLTLGGANTYTGATLVEAGGLSVTGSLTSNVTVADGAALLGTGTIVGDVVAGAGATLAPGESIGTLTVTGNLAIAGTFDVEYDSDTQTIDLLNVSG
ncbi:MAG: hypothetical protein GX621_11965, partial [Pirellulaceae bacterium]|nr:hypothetical protein [Pirellulaceae bacterium]